MEVNQACVEMLLAADGKALATHSSSSGVNVVPVSSIKIIEGEIVLVNYFFRQTLKNIQENPDVSLACWKGLEGFQVKCTARYEIEGKIFDDITTWIKETLPDRVVKGVVVLTPTSVFDVSADALRAGKKVG
jgi:predicted pyridoxine 5'-phosphate oxidase superfamily flavin-nucleotide-binding protein